MSDAPSPLQSVSVALSAAVAGAAKSVVSVHSHRSRSSGFVWRQGLIVTADESLRRAVGGVGVSRTLSRAKRGISGAAAFIWSRLLH